MYTHIKQVQIIISLLKQNNIRHFVISPGTRHVPLVHSVEIDPFFSCYSVVDERSAAFVALGLSESLGEPVCITCTSSTASCNYMPAMQEAFERNIPIIALTSDRARYQRFHGENQCINQVDMYKPYCKCSVDLPLVKNEEDYWYCNRCVNEALINISRNGTGPVQINFLEPLNIQELSTFENNTIPKTRKINVVEGDVDWDCYYKALKGKKILVICGQLKTNNEELKRSLLSFNEKFEAVISTDYFANTNDGHFIHTPGLDNVLNYFEYQDLQPDIIISFGTKVYSGFGVVYRGKGIPHWFIDEDGTIYDPMHSLQNVFVMAPSVFFAKMAEVSVGHNSKRYFELWKQRKDKVSFETSRFTNFYAIKEALARFPDGGCIHVSVLNSMRLTNFCVLPEDTLVMGNICADGIDGALSTFLGHAMSTSRLSLLVIGDLSYLYDLNVSFENIPSNVRVLLVNNNAGAEFHYNIGIERINTLNRHIAASHNNQFMEISNIGNFCYMRATNKEELSECLSKFFGDSSKPQMLEVITDADTDGHDLRAMIANNRKKIKIWQRLVARLKSMVKRLK